MEAVSYPGQFDTLEVARRTIRREAAALQQLADRIGADFVAAAERLESCRGSVIVTGMGKAGLIGQKVSATFCSTGTRSHFLHPAEAIHGDLGRVSRDDIVLALSMSGETEELVKVLPSLRQLSAGIIAITSQSRSALGRFSSVVIELGRLQEAGSNGLAPSTSTTAMLALGDALALSLCEKRGFGSNDFARFHPGGSLGRRLTPVLEIMRPLSECRVAGESHTVRETFTMLRRPGRRSGAVMIVDRQGKLVGVFTDSDLARLLERQTDELLDAPVADVMTRQPFAIESSSMMPKAVQILAENQISELPVVEPGGQLLGLIDITDVIGWLPKQDETFAATPTLVPFRRSERRDAQ